MTTMISLVDERNGQSPLPNVHATTTSRNFESISVFVSHRGTGSISMSRSGAMTEAIRVRREWLSLMGYSEAEVIEALKADVPPLNLQAELFRLEAAKRHLASPPSYEEFRAFLDKKLGRDNA